MSVFKKDRIRAQRRKLRVRNSLQRGTSAVPRISVFRSLQHIYVQIIDDVRGVTLASSSSLVVDVKEGTKKDVAHKVGLDIAQKAKEQGISAAMFDRGQCRYTGRVQALAEGVRQGGIQV